jgi:hypothetical protein
VGQAAPSLRIVVEEIERVVAPVPRTGGTALAVVVVWPGSGQSRPVSQTRPERQQPPPKLAGQGVKSAAPSQADADVVVDIVVGFVVAAGCVTVWITVTDTVLTHPTSKQTKPATQHAPPIFCGHAVCPAAQLVICPAHVEPRGQQPTGPRPVSVILKQSSPVAQQ